MSGTVYLKIEKNVQIHSRIVSFKDIAQIVADDNALENKIRVLKLPPDTGLKKRNSPGACMPGARPRWWRSSLFSGRPLPS